MYDFLSYDEDVFTTVENYLNVAYYFILQDVSTGAELAPQYYVPTTIIQFIYSKFKFL